MTCHAEEKKILLPSMLWTAMKIYNYSLIFYMFISSAPRLEANKGRNGSSTYAVRSWASYRFFSILAYDCIMAY